MTKVVRDGSQWRLMNSCSKWIWLFMRDVVSRFRNCLKDFQTFQGQPSTQLLQTSSDTTNFVHGTKMLRDINKERRMAYALTFLLRYADTGEQFVNQIATGDETWSHSDNEETKLQVQQWIHAHSPNKPKKFKQTFSNKKRVATVFWDHQGVLLIDFMEPGITINAAAYCVTTTINSQQTERNTDLRCCLAS
ncbi:hypothetical protein PR048_021021 [Dryococelus australis]|uniref:Uncharacterized protein n=1 Tax=Dryococelus australis TaxID=614101 RepID=A0ABQ9GX58_9NEOP|nr:hypothetical protein PR048_021021 [Dryococelus australis]